MPPKSVMIIITQSVCAMVMVIFSWTLKRVQGDKIEKYFTLIGHPELVSGSN